MFVPGLASDTHTYYGKMALSGKGRASEMYSVPQIPCLTATRHVFSFRCSGNGNRGSAHRTKNEELTGHVALAPVSYPLQPGISYGVPRLRRGVQGPHRWLIFTAPRRWILRATRWGGVGRAQSLLQSYNPKAVFSPWWNMSQLCFFFFPPMFPP